MNLRLMLILIVAPAVAAGCAPSSASPSPSADDPCLRAGICPRYATCDRQESAEKLIRMLDDDDQAVRFYASAALFRRSGERFEYQPQDTPARRAAAIRRAIQWHNQNYPQAAHRLDDLDEKLEQRFEPQDKKAAGQPMIAP